MNLTVEKTVKTNILGLLFPPFHYFSFISSVCHSIKSPVVYLRQGAAGVRCKLAFLMKSRQLFAVFQRKTCLNQRTLNRLRFRFRFAGRLQEKNTEFPIVVLHSFRRKVQHTYARLMLGFYFEKATVVFICLPLSCRLPSISQSVSQLPAYENRIQLILNSISISINLKSRNELQPEAVEQAREQQHHRYHFLMI